jgi:hypothetical protein
LLLDAPPLLVHASIGLPTGLRLSLELVAALVLVAALILAAAGQRLLAARLLDGLLATAAVAFDLGVAELRLALGLLTPLLFHALADLLALACLFGNLLVAALHLLLALAIVPARLGLRAFGLRLLALLGGLRLGGLRALLLALFLARRAAVVLVVVVIAALLCERGGNAGHRKQGRHERCGERAGSGKAVHRVCLHRARPIRARCAQLAMARMNRC